MSNLVLSRSIRFGTSWLICFKNYIILMLTLTFLNILLKRLNWGVAGTLCNPLCPRREWSWYPFRRKWPLQRRTSWMKTNQTVMRKNLHNLWRFYVTFLLTFQVQGYNIRECRILRVEAPIIKPIFFILWSFFSQSPIGLKRCRSNCAHFLFSIPVYDF